MLVSMNVVMEMMEKMKIYVLDPVREGAFGFGSVLETSADTIVVQVEESSV